MEIYIITAGGYDCNHIVNVTTDYDEALQTILKHYNYSTRPENERVEDDEDFTALEVWENGAELYCYGGMQREVVKSYRKLSTEELHLDIQKRKAYERQILLTRRKA